MVVVGSPPPGSAGSPLVRGVFSLVQRQGLVHYFVPIVFLSDVVGGGRL